MSKPRVCDWKWSRTDMAGALQELESGIPVYELSDEAILVAQDALLRVYTQRCETCKEFGPMLVDEMGDFHHCEVTGDVWERDCYCSRWVAKQ